MLFGNPIRKEIMKVIDSKIEEGEKEYKQGVEQLMEEVTVQLDAIHEKVKTDKIALKEKIVSKIIGKIL